MAKRRDRSNKKVKKREANLPRPRSPAPEKESSGRESKPAPEEHWELSSSQAEASSEQQPPEEELPPAHNKGESEMATKSVTSDVPPPIVFLDMKERNDAERTRLLARQADLLQLQANNNGATLPPDLAQELNDIKAELAADALGDGSIVLDPFFNQPTWDVRFDSAGFKNTSPVGSLPGVRDVLGSIRPPAVGNHIDGLLPSQQNNSSSNFTPGSLPDPEISLAAVFGLLENDNNTDPHLERFVVAVSAALGEYTHDNGLFDAVLQLIIEGVTESNSTESRIRADQWTAVVRVLRAQGVDETNKDNLKLLVNVALAGVIGADDTAPPSSIAIDLPDLEAQTDEEIVADNLRAMQAIYFAAQLEELNFFKVVEESLLPQFQNGMLPLGKGSAGNQLYSYWKKSVNRMSEVERRNLYSRTFGFAGGDATGSPNREFTDLWFRFVSAVSSFVRQVTVDDLLRAGIPMQVSQQQVKKAARDLASNLSLHGYGIGYFAATDLQTQIKEIISLLSDPDIKNAYGARDMWQVIDQIASLELGGAKNSVRYRTMATSGAIIIRWLAERTSLLASTTVLTVLDLTQIRNLTSPRARSVKPTVNPTDRDLFDACDQWLAVTGTQEQRVEEYSQPIEAPNLTSRPVYVPQIARDALAGLGVDLPSFTAQPTSAGNGSTTMMKK